MNPGLRLLVLAAFLTAAPAGAEEPARLPEVIVVVDEAGSPLPRAALRRTQRAQVGVPVHDERAEALATGAPDGALALPLEARDAAADPPFVVSAPGRRPQPLFLVTAQARLALPPGERLSGRVRWSAGPPVAAARLLLLPGAGRRGVGLALSADAQGRWSTTQAAPGVSKLLLERPDGRRIVLRAFDTAVHGGAAEVPEVVAPTGGGLSVRLLDADSRAAAGLLGAALVEVTLTRLPREGAAPPLRARSDADGRFLLDALEPGVYELAVGSPDWLLDEPSGAVEVPEAGVLREATFTLRRRPTVVGRAADPDGKPLAGVSVRLLPDAGDATRRASGPLPSPSAASEADGRFVLRGAVPGRGWRLLLATAGRAPLISEPFEIGERGATDAGTFRLLSGWTLTVDVRDAQGRQVDGARVRATPAEVPGAGVVAELALLERSARTDDRGTAVLDALPRQDAYLTVEWSGHLTFVQQVPWPGGAGAARVRVELAAAPELRGRVLDSLGLPAAGLLVRALVAGVEGGVAAAARTGDDGTFVLAGLVERPHDIEVLAAHGRPLLLVPGVSPADSPLELALPATAAISGSVEGLRPDGPTALALLEAPVLDPRGERRWRVVEQSTLPRGLTNAFFRFERLTPGDYAVRVVQGSVDSDAAPAHLDGRDVDLYPLRLGEPCTVAGSVLDEQGRALLGVPVRVKRVRGDGDQPRLPGGPWEAVSDERGTYLFVGLGVGLWRVEAGDDVLGVDGETVRLSEGDTLVVRDLLPASGGTIEGRVASPRGGALDGVRVRARPFAADSEPRETRTRPDGSYRIAGLEAGTWSVEVAFGGRQTQRREAAVEVVVGETTRLDFAPPMVGEIGGTVTREGKRAAGVTVRLSWEPGDGSTLSQVRSDSTDSLGTYRFEGLDPGTYRLVIEDGAARTGGDVEIGEGERLTADLELWDGRVAGEVIDLEGRPVPHALVRAQPSAAVVGELLAQARAGPDGRFLLAGLPVGRYDLAVLARGRVQARQAGVQADVPGADRPVTIVLGRGGEVDIEVRGPDGRPVGGARLEVVAADAPDLESVVAVTGPSGRVRVTGVSPGTVMVSAHARNLGRVRGQVTVAEGETARLDLRMEPCGSLHLQVWSDTIDPTPRARIDVVAPDGQVVARRRPLGPLWLQLLWSREPRTGVLRLGDLAAGDYEVRINAGPRFEPTRTQVRVRAGEPTRAVVKLLPAAK